MKAIEPPPHSASRSEDRRRIPYLRRGISSGLDRRTISRFVLEPDTGALQLSRCRAAALMKLTKEDALASRPVSKAVGW